MKERRKVYNARELQVGQFGISSPTSATSSKCMKNCFYDSISVTFAWMMSHVSSWRTWKSSKNCENFEVRMAVWKCPCCNVWERSSPSSDSLSLSRAVKSSFTVAFDVKRRDVKTPLSPSIRQRFLHKKFSPFAIAFVLDERMLTSM